MTNPSQITITLGTINFDVIYGSSNSVIGKVYLENLTITPGSQSYTVKMHLGEGSTDQAAVGSILTSYLTDQNVPLSIKGSETSTDIAPLKAGLEKVTLDTSMQGILANLVRNVAADLEPPNYDWASATITIYNPLDTPFSILSVKATTSYTVVCSITGNVGEVISVGVIDYTLPEPATIQPKDSQTFVGWPITGISLDTAVPMLPDPYAAISLSQVVVTLVNNVYNTGEITYTESGVPVLVTLGGNGLYPFTDNDAFNDYTCQCQGYEVHTLPLENFTNQDTCLDGHPVVYRTPPPLYTQDTSIAPLAATLPTPALNATTTLAPTSTTSTTDSVTATLLTTTDVPAATGTATEDSNTPTATDASTDPTPTEEPAAPPETQTTSDGTSAPTDS
jgi:hypothetical protein